MAFIQKISDWLDPNPLPRYYVLFMFGYFCAFDNERKRFCSFSSCEDAGTACRMMNNRTLSDENIEAFEWQGGES